MVAVGRRIRAARRDAGLTQDASAARAGIDLKRWQRLEQGTVNATLRTLTRVAEALGLTFWELLDEAEAVEQEPRRRRTRTK